MMILHIIIIRLRRPKMTILHIIIIIRLRRPGLVVIVVVIVVVGTVTDGR